MNDTIKIKLPEYIENIFNHNSGKIDYLKNTFDDRKMNIEAFYELNFQIYKNLLKEKKYNDKLFLEIKRNLYYLYESGIIRGEINFIFSSLYNENYFIKDELEKYGTNFDKYCSYVIQEDSKNIVKYLKGLKQVNNILKKEILGNKFYSLIILQDFLDKEVLFDLVENIFTREELIDFIKNERIFIYNFLIVFLSKKGLEYIFKLNIKKYILKLILDDNGRRRPNLLDYIVNSNISTEFIKYLDLEEYLKLNNEKINKKSLTKTKKVKLKEINNSYITEKELKQISKGKIKLENKLHQILRSEEGIKFLEKNYKKEEIVKYFKKNENLFICICNTNYGLKYLRKLDLDKDVIAQIKMESKKGRIYALLDHLFKREEGREYLKKLNKNDIIKENLLFDIILFRSEDFKNFKDFNGLYIEEKFKLALQEKDKSNEGIDGLFHSLSNTKEGIKIIIDANVKDKIKKSILETKDYHYMYTLRFFNDTEDGKQYLKDILSLETDSLKIQLGDFIKTSNSGSCLLSGYRGTGKTSLLNNVIKKVQNETEEDIIKVVVNIPEQKKDKNGYKKSFNKNELLVKIIREIYHSLEKSGINKKEIYGFEEQYIRTFKNLEEIEGSLKVTRNFGYKIVIQIISFSFSFIVGLFLTYLFPYLIKISEIGVFKEFLKIDNIKLYLAIVLIILSYFVSITIFNFKFKGRFERTLYNDDIAEYKLNENIKNFSNNIGFLEYFQKLFSKEFYSNKFKKISDFLKNIGKKKKRKIVIIIDELDKLLDFDKGIGKGDIDMKEIFDLLGKLKTLFFDNSGAIFFVVTNKDAYNYYLENKHSEDDLISNIFNKVLYLSMTRKENFNINRAFKIEGIDENNKNFNNKIKNEYFNDWIYYKSHGNWRKANFILNQKLNNGEIIFNKEHIEYDMKFYNFMNVLYDLFINENFKIEKVKFDNNFTFGKPFYLFINEFILKYKFYEVYDNNYQGIIRKLRNSINHLKLNEEIINKEELNNKIIELTKKYMESEAFNTFAYIHSSVDKISSESAYRDFIINSILNILEILKHDRTLRIEDILMKLKFTELDVKYPAFEDLILIYIPFMIYYFDNLKENEK